MPLSVTLNRHRAAREEAYAKLEKLGSAAYTLSRSHLDALAKALGVSKTTRDGASKKELFRVVTGFLPGTAGLRPGVPGREIP